jgi:MerR family transcriptional regulator, repressor of the yfmOP operon
MTEQNELGQILALLNKLDTDIRATNEKLEKEIEENKKKSEETREQFKKWDERYFNLVKEQGNTARTIIIAAASVVVLSPVLGAVADLVKNHLNW